MTDPQSADGVLIVDKPAGWTSHDVVARVRKLLKTRRVGHTGTLDPFATGVLVICVNRATRLAQFLTGDDKEYIATMRLGFATDTGDLTGQPISPAADARHITEESVREALPHFRGRIQQIPPMYSAKKIGGVKLYEMARRGETIERKPIEIEIKELEMCGMTETSPATSTDSTQDVSFRVVCSSGTYVRTLAEDIGKRLGIGAHLSALRRTRAGQCDIGHALTLERLAERIESNEADRVLIPMSDALALTEIPLNEEERKAVTHGRSIGRQGDWRNGERAKLVDSNRELIALAEFAQEKLVWRPLVVLGV